MKEKNYAFIDGNNLHLGTSKSIYITKHGKRKRKYKGWKIDYKKFRQYLTDKYKIRKAFYYIGYSKKYWPLYRNLRRFGFQVIHKQTTLDNTGKLKGNVDAELVLGASAIQFDKYDKAVIVAGDGDYACLCNFLNKKRKLLKIIIPNRLSESSLLKKFQEYKVFIEKEKHKLELDK